MHELGIVNSTRFCEIVVNFWVCSSNFVVFCFCFCFVVCSPLEENPRHRWSFLSWRNSFIGAGYYWFSVFSYWETKAHRNKAKRNSITWRRMERKAKERKTRQIFSSDRFYLWRISCQVVECRLWSNGLACYLLETQKSLKASNNIILHT